MADKKEEIQEEEGQTLEMQKNVNTMAKAPRKATITTPTKSAKKKKRDNSKPFRNAHRIKTATS